MADDDDDNVGPNAADAREAMELKIDSALRSREEYIKEHAVADFLTVFKVWRLLEKDMGMERFTLGEYKNYIKRRMFEILGVTGDVVDKGLKTEIATNDALLMAGKVTDSVNGNQLDKDLKASVHVNNDTADESPVPGLISGNGKTQERIKRAQGDVIDESIVKAALLKRESFFRANLDITMVGALRLLEGDLKLGMYRLDPFRMFITRELNEILKPPPVLNTQISLENIVSKKASKKVDNEVSSEGTDRITQESSEEDSSSRKSGSSKGKDEDRD